MTGMWKALGPDLKTIILQEPDPLQALAEGHIAGIVLRGVYPAEYCRNLIRRFLDKGLMRDPVNPNPALEGTYNEVVHQRTKGDIPLRIDIGSSLANLNRYQTPFDDKEKNKEAFLEHSESTQELFKELFAGIENPVDCLYKALSELSVGKEVKIAYEPDGRQYGPAIFRIHYEGQEYGYHANHVKIVDKLFNYQAARFEHNFAGLICIQNPSSREKSPHALIHRCPWSPDVQEHLTHQTYESYMRQNQIEEFDFSVDPGDFYLFNSGLIHTVRPFISKVARIVLATFIGFSKDDEEIFVWS